MSQRSRPDGPPRTGARARHTTTRPGDDLLNQQVADALRHAAEARQSRDRTTSAEDLRANERMQAAVRALIEGHPA